LDDHLSWSRHHHRGSWVQFIGGWAEGCVGSPDEISGMDALLRVNDLKTFFYTPEGIAKAINGVSFSLNQSEIIGIVGESGCGKSVTALSILRLVPHPGRIISGQIWLKGQDLLQLPIRHMRQIRGDRISMIFQEPMISLNPAFTVGEQLMEALRVHRQMTHSEARERAIEMLQKVEIPAPEKRFSEYPHQLSGGMRQRVMIAEALLFKPEILLADEPTTALDVTIQAQILDMIYKLTEEIGVAVILITHNLGLVAESARRLLVMYAGRVVEEGPIEAVFEKACHPYTQGLLRSIPMPGQRQGQKTQLLYEIKGIVPSLFDLPVGCAFHPRCTTKKDMCSQEEPPWVSIGPDHHLACWLFA
jgi:peptide/nickel transport system ATP-binding protein